MVTVTSYKIRLWQVGKSIIPSPPHIDPALHRHVNVFSTDVMSASQGYLVATWTKIVKSNAVNASLNNLV